MSRRAGLRWLGGHNRGIAVTVSASAVRATVVAGTYIHPSAIDRRYGSVGFVRVRASAKPILDSEREACLRRSICHAFGTVDYWLNLLYVELLAWVFCALFEDQTGDR